MADEHVLSREMNLQSIIPFHGSGRLYGVNAGAVMQAEKICDAQLPCDPHVPKSPTRCVDQPVFCFQYDHVNMLLNRVSPALTRRMTALLKVVSRLSY